jgi:hypothetical protein
MFPLFCALATSLDAVRRYCMPGNRPDRLRRETLAKKAKYGQHYHGESYPSEWMPRPFADIPCARLEYQSIRILFPVLVF